MNLSEHFTLEELTYSDTAKKYGIDNTPTEAHLKTLKHTCQYLLEPLRKLFNEKYGKAIIQITSGYRGKTLNAKVGGVVTSQHCKGEAVDFDVYIYTNNVKTKLAYNITYNNIKEWVQQGKLSVDQCLQEKSGSALWVHCSYKAAGESKNRKDFKKTTDGGKTFITEKVTTKSTTTSLPYKVKTKQELNIRTGAGTNYSIIRTAKKNEILTVWAIENNWGKNGKEYFCLDYCKKI